MFLNSEKDMKSTLHAFT